MVLPHSRCDPEIKRQYGELLLLAAQREDEQCQKAVKWITSLGVPYETDRDGNIKINKWDVP